MNKRLSSSRRIPPILVLFAIIGSLFSALLLPSSAYAAWFDSSWQYRREITVDNTGNSAKTDYPVKVELTSANFSFANAEADGTDIRFTDSDGETLLDFWRESYNNGAETATFWVEMPSVPNNDTTTIFIYYGNSGAASTSNGADVFTFFEDWSSAPVSAIEQVDIVSALKVRNKGALANPVAVKGGTGWRQNQVRESFVLYDELDADADRRYKAYVSGSGSIGLYTAPSLNGPWTEHASNPIIDTNSPENPHVIIDTNGDLGAANTYHMWVEQTPASKIFHFTSADGITWSIANGGSAVLSTGVSTTLASEATSGSSTIEVNSETGFAVGDIIRLAASETAEIQALDGGAGPTFTWTLVSTLSATHASSSSVGQFDGGFVASPSVFIEGGIAYMVYEGGEAGGSPPWAAAALATSTDGDSWTKQGAIILPAEDGGISDLQIVFDSAVKVGTTWYGTSHDLGPHDGVNDWRVMIYKTTDQPANWTRASWAKVGTNPVDDGSGAKLINDGTRQSVVVSDSDKTEIWVAQFVGTSKWRVDYTERVEGSTDSVETSDVYVSSGELSITSRREASAGGDFYNTHIIPETALNLTNNFLIAVRKKQIQAAEDSDNDHSAIGFGSGGIAKPDFGFGPRAHVVAFAEGITAQVEQPGAEDGTHLVVNTGGAATRAALETLSAADASAFNIHELSYLSDGSVEYKVGGASIATHTDNTFVANNNDIVIGQADASGSSQSGGQTVVDWQYVRTYDGEDPSITLAAEESVPQGGGGSSIGISSVAVEDITANSARVRWNTSLATNNTRLVGEPAPVDSGDTQTKTSHEALLTDLSPGTLYSYTIQAGLPGRGVQATASLAFKTPAAGQDDPQEPATGTEEIQESGQLEALRRQIRELQLKVIELSSQLVRLLQQQISAAQAI